MSPGEMVARGQDKGRQWAWTRRQVHPGQPITAPREVRGVRAFESVLPDAAREEVAPDARRTLLEAADLLMAGTWDVLGTVRTDMAAPDWFGDPVTGRTSPSRDYAFRIDHRDEAVTGNVKSVWELSRHHHLTVLAAAYWLTNDERYAERVDQQLRSWWQANPYLSGIHWTSGIELGVRLMSWVWIRRLLDDWPKVGDLFESNEVALAQLHWHQEYLSAFRSGGSSANNHVVLEAAGRVSAACAFPWFAESDEWRRDALSQFESTYQANTFDSGINRELATDYHRFVAETAVLVSAEAAAAGSPLSERTWELVVASFDAAAALVDVAMNPPRQGDGDDGRALVVDDPRSDSWHLMIDIGRCAVGPLPWWPHTDGSVLGPMVAAVAGGPRSTDARPPVRPATFGDAGITILRTDGADEPEIWCRCDGGPHGFLSIAAHGHADALSIEVRHDGVEVLVDPGTYCYHGEPQWRGYFRSTRAHNSIEVDGLNQSVEGGPFMWSRHAGTVVDHVGPTEVGHHSWVAHHDGYAELDEPLGHRRSVTLDADLHRLVVVDDLSSTGAHRLAMSFHLGPSVDAQLRDGAVALSWLGPRGRCHATLELPPHLDWTAHHGETDPPLGWYSPRFGEREPITTIVGRGVVDRSSSLITILQFPGPLSDQNGRHG